ncbi:hypothetical protein Afil01_29030 [Actinorhabdospora filicis]|uniref:Uncharacterized protein n=1 Tax=Actinorhabdospora filicis TaxID=1785913 RepID=A0A9W6WA03_9ACTN|nr:hypothetical protein [Actinorhabdospora filicis]GLZ78096.1 hypothetical protein Afil01_29030 [Actinorhabdospora filicis]
MTPHEAFTEHPRRYLAERGLAAHSAAFEPLTAAIIALTADHAWVTACAGTWRTVAASLSDDRDAMLASIECDLPTASGGYRRRFMDVAETVGRMSSRALDLVVAAEGVTAAVERARGLVVGEFLAAVAAMHRPDRPEDVTEVLAGHVERVAAVRAGLDVELAGMRAVLVALTERMAGEAGRLETVTE